MVGVPAFTWCACGPTSRMFCPTDRRRRVRMNHGPISQESSSAVTIAAADWAAGEVRPGDLVIVKASRGVGLDKVVRRLLGESGAGEGGH